MCNTCLLKISHPGKTGNLFMRDVCGWGSPPLEKLYILGKVELYNQASRPPSSESSERALHLC